MDDDLADVLRMLVEQQANMPKNLSLEQQRAGFEANGSAMPMPEEPHDIASLVLGGVPSIRITPRDAAVGKAILYFHGGGYVFGSSLSHRHLTARIAVDAGITVWSVDYRLAPENPYPAAIEDALAAFDGLLESEALSATDIVLAGDSAGGGLAQALMLSLREAGRAMPAGAALLSPWVDLRANATSYKTRAAQDPMLTREQLLGLAALYVDPTRAAEPLASPVHAVMTGFPELYVQVGDNEVLLDDSRQLVAKAQDSGVLAHLDVYPHMFHVFQYFWPMLPTARTAVSKLAQEMNRMLAVANEPPEQ